MQAASLQFVLARFYQNVGEIKRVRLDNCSRLEYDEVVAMIEANLSNV